MVSVVNFIAKLKQLIHVDDVEVQNAVVRAKKLLRTAGLPAPDIDTGTTDNWLSYTDCISDVFFGKGAALMHKLKVRDLAHTALHEMLHILVEEYVPTKGIRQVFGNKRAWDADQNLTAALQEPSGHFVSRYAQTHPDEDFVETLAFVIEGYAGIDGESEWLHDKIEAAEEWVDCVRGLVKDDTKKRVNQAKRAKRIKPRKAMSSMIPSRRGLSVRHT